MFNVNPIMYTQRIWHLPINILCKKYRLICIDLDNTLDIPQKRTGEVIKEVSFFIDELKKRKIEIIVISNNSLPGRCESFCNLVDLAYISSAKKPFLFNIKKNSIISSYKKEEILFIGDKMVTDVLCAKWYGVDAVLVDQLLSTNNMWYSKFMATSERVFCKLNGFKKGDYFVKEM